MRSSRLASLIAVLALAVCGTALGSTAVAGYAAGKVKGNTIIKKHSLSGNRLKADSVTGDQVAEGSLGTVPHAAVADGLTPGKLTVLPPVFVSQLVGFNSVGTRPLGFRKDAAGFVHLQGEVTATSITSVTIIQLPPGARPGGDIKVIVPAGSGSDFYPARLVIRATGEVQFDKGNSSANISLEGVTFFADQ